MVWFRRSRNSKNAIAYFLKKAKAVALQLRSPPAEEANVLNLEGALNNIPRLKILDINRQWTRVFIPNNNKNIKTKQ